MMVLNQFPRWLTISIAFPILFLDGWLILSLCRFLEPITSIFLTACLFAFLLNYLISFLEQRGMNRGSAIGLVLVLSLLLLTILGFVIAPFVFQQLVEFGKRLPAWIEAAETQLQALDNQTVLQRLPIDLSEITTQITTQLSVELQSLTNQTIALALGTINSTFNLLTTLILTIFLVFTGQELWQGLLSWFPTVWSQLIQTSLRESFQNYFAGQAVMATILSLLLTSAFWALQIPFGLLFGLGIGIASLIPFGGVLSITVVSLLLAAQNIWLGVKMLLVALVLGQINDTIVAPRLIGSMTGLNPTWVVVVLLLGAKFGGVLGLLVAVPTASFIKRIAETLQADRRVDA